MKPSSTGVVVCLCVVALGLPGFCREIGFETRFWRSRLDAEVTVDTKTTFGTPIDADADLNLGERETVPEYRFWFGLGRGRVVSSYARIENTGSQTLSKDIVFKGITFNVNEKVTTEVKASLADLFVEYPLVSVASGRVILNGIAGVKYVDFDGRLKSTFVKIEEKIDTPFPQIGASCEIPFSWGRCWAGLSGASVKESDTRWEVLDATMAAEWDWRGIRLSGGYRVLALQIKDDALDLEMEYSGPYAGLTWLF
jgi:hypothetical protein